MKRYMMMLMMATTVLGNLWAMDYETARERAYYLTDKMAYELNLNDQQYNDAYEINLDYLLSLNTAGDLADTRYLAYRNDDLRHILYDWQWAAFAAVDYLFRPVWWLNGGWFFPVFRHYAHGHYFYHRPSVFRDYRGGHGRFYFSHGFYHDRRPIWSGGLRGTHRSMVGHDTWGRGHNGHPGVGPGGHNSRGGQGYHFDRGGHQPNSGHQPGSNGYQPNSNGHRPNASERHSGKSQTGHGVTSRGSSMGSSRGSSFSSGSSRGSSFSSGSSRGRSLSAGSSRGGSFSGGTRGSLSGGRR